MIDPTASLTFADVDASGDLVFTGTRTGSGYTVLTMNRPAFTPRITRADPSPFTAGSLPTHGVPEESVLAALVELSGASQAEIETKLARLKTAVYRRSYPVAQELNGAVNNFTGSYGTVDPGEVTYTALANLRQRCAITVPLPKGAA